VRGSSISTSLGKAVSELRRDPPPDLGTRLECARKGGKERRRSGRTILGMEDTMPRKQSAFLKNLTR
jgi:hypothetical protein